MQHLVNNIQVENSVEHTIGVLKARFASLRVLPNSSRMNASKMEWCYAWIGACVVVHNLLLKFNDPWAPEEDIINEILIEETQERNGIGTRNGDVLDEGNNHDDSHRKRDELYSEFLRLAA